MKWTKEQLEFLNNSGSCIVSASAGTGKTAVLTEKVIKLIEEENIKLDELLVITFTNSAAEEIKYRIKNRLEELIKKNNDIDRYKKELSKIDNAHIQTVHSFCYDLVKEYCNENGTFIPEIINETDAQLAKKDIVKKILNSMDKNDFKKIYIAINGLKSIEDVILDVYDKIYSMLNPNQFLEFALKQYDIKNNKVPEYIKEKIKEDMTRVLSIYNQTIEKSNCLKMEKNLKELILEKEKVEDVLLNINNKLLSDFDYNFFKSALRFSKEYEDVKILRDSARDILKKYENFNINDELNKILYAKPIMKILIEIIKKIDKNYSIYKKENACIDYNNLEKEAIKILNDKAYNSLIKDNIKYVIVDEYQDISDTQEEIINSLDKETICVGDYKQSIYGFRNANPKIFYNRSKNSNKVFYLSENFRSEKNILDGVNDIFNYLKSKSSGLDYNEKEQLKTSKTIKNEYNKINLYTIENKTEENNDYIEALNVCDIIKENIGKEIIKNEKKDKVKYSDFTVILRKISGIGETVEKAFKEKGIPYKIERSTSLVDELEIEMLINILNFNNDIELISMMFSNLFGFSKEKLIELRMQNEKNSLMENFINNIENKENEKIKKYLEYKQNNQYENIEDLINYAIEKSNFKEWLFTLPNVRQRINNIDNFINFANDFEEKYGKNIEDFIKYIEKVKDENILVENKNSTDEDCVTITTIHKSKGLEYPIVILPFLSKSFSIIDSISPININKDIGIGVKYYNETIKGNTMLKNIISDKNEKENIEEEMRLFYVATTRAKNMLYLQGMQEKTRNNSIMGFLTNIPEDKKEAKWDFKNIVIEK